MIDERFERDLGNALPHLSRDVGRLIASVGGAFRALARVQFDAPWQAKPTRRVCEDAPLA